MCVLLNNYFSSVFTRESIGIDDEFLPRIDCKVEQADKLLTVTVDEGMVSQGLRNLKRNKAPGVDGLASDVLCELCDILSSPLCCIFNKSLSEGSVPEDWKNANVCAIFKKGSRWDCGNYRPVSLTSHVCKLLETFLKDANTNHLEIGLNLIGMSQHGIRKRKSCLTNMLQFLKPVTEAVDAPIPVYVI
jgi:hypothetical protein